MNNNLAGAISIGIDVLGITFGLWLALRWMKKRKEKLKEK